MACLLCAESGTVITVDGEDYCEVCGEEFKCSLCGEYSEDMECHDGANYCESCFDAEFACCDDCGEYFPKGDLIDIDGSSYCDSCVYDNFTTCDDCDEYVRNDDVYHVNGDDYCQSCADSYSCRHCGCIESEMEEIKGDWYCHDCRDSQFIVCDHCGDYEPVDDSYSDDYNTYCSYCYENNYFTCESCCQLYSYDDSIEHDGCLYCSDCAPEDCETRCVGNPITSDSFEVVKSDRWYGVEIETDSGDYEDTPSQWGIHNDISIDGMELVSPLLQGDAGLDSIREVYHDVRPGFDSSCGLHVHIDVRDLTEQQRFDVIKAFITTKSKWFGYVDEYRHSHKFCCDEVPAPRFNEDWNTYLSRSRREAADCSRYRWCNIESVSDHGSIEIRLHEGSRDIEKVIKWIAMLVNFVSEVAAMGAVEKVQPYMV